MAKALLQSSTLNPPQIEFGEDHFCYKEHNYQRKYKDVYILEKSSRLNLKYFHLDIVLKRK